MTLEPAINTDKTLDVPLDYIGEAPELRPDFERFLAFAARHL